MSNVQREVFMADGEDLPLGQRLLANGFYKITKEEIHEQLKIDELNKKIKDEVEQRLKERYNGTKRIKINRYNFSSLCVTYERRWYGWEDVDELYFKKYEVKYTKIDNYIDKVIPKKCLDSMNRARKLGVVDFLVAHPSLEAPDPIIVAKLGDQLIYIDHWQD